MWIKCSERMPEPDQLVLMWLVDPQINKASAWVGHGSGFIFERATHWMPLPDPPTD